MSEDGINIVEDIKKLKKELNELSLFVYGKTLTPHGWKVEKFEEIKQKAWEIYKLATANSIERHGGICINNDITTEEATSWMIAERFCNFAKREKNDD